MQKQRELPSAYQRWDDLHQSESHSINNFAKSNVELNHKVSNWVFSKNHILPIIGEMQIWIQSYLGLNLSGLKILDVGAGEGETAKFFLDHGAAKVVCVEPQTQKYRYLARNAAKHPTFLALKKTISLSDLKLPYDFLKCDLESCEEELLDANLTIPAIVKVHSQKLLDEFKRSRWRISSNNSLNDYGCKSCAYWMC